jgi:hypothetical protein
VVEVDLVPQRPTLPATKRDRCRDTPLAGKPSATSSPRHRPLSSDPEQCDYLPGDPVPPAAALRTDGWVPGLPTSAGGGAAAMLMPSADAASPECLEQCDAMRTTWWRFFLGCPSVAQHFAACSDDRPPWWWRSSCCSFAHGASAPSRTCFHTPSGWRCGASCTIGSQAPHPPALEKVKAAHDMVALQAGDPRARGNDAADGMAKGAAHDLTAPVHHPDARFADAVRLRNHRVHNVSEAITKYSWSGRLAEGTQRRGWLAQLHPSGLELDWRSSPTSSILPPSLGGAGLLRACRGTPCVKWASRVTSQHRRTCHVRSQSRHGVAGWLLPSLPLLIPMPF